MDEVGEVGGWDERSLGLGMLLIWYANMQGYSEENFPRTKILYSVEFMMTIYSLL